MNYENRVVCFIDILGFKNIIENTVDCDGNDIPDKIESVDALLKKILEFKRLDDEWNLAHLRTVTQFSDSIVISFRVALNELFSTFIDIQHIIFNFFRYGFLIRGGISYGKIIHTDKTIFGPALNCSYYMESKEAIYPRVLVHSKIIDYLKSNQNDFEFEDKSKYILELISKDDSDGKHYIDFLENVIENFDKLEQDYLNYLICVSKTISTGLENTQDKVLKKYEWLAEKYDQAVIKQQLIYKEEISNTDPENLFYEDGIEFELKNEFLQLPVFNLSK